MPIMYRSDLLEPALLATYPKSGLGTVPETRLHSPPCLTFRGWPTGARTARVRGLLGVRRAIVWDLTRTRVGDSQTTWARLDPGRPGAPS